MNVVKDPSRGNVQVDWPTGQTDLITDEPVAVPDGAEHFALSLIRETGIIKETNKKPKPPKSFMEAVETPKAEDAKDEEDEEKKSKRSSKK